MRASICRNSTRSGRPAPPKSARSASPDADASRSTARSGRRAVSCAMVWKPDVTVAAVIERDGRFLLVRGAHPRPTGVQPARRARRGRRDRCSRRWCAKRCEETAWRLHARGTAGHLPVAQPARPLHAALRLQRHGGRLRCPPQPLDPPIVATHWLTRADIARPRHARCARRWCCAASTTTSAARACRSTALALVTARAMPRHSRQSHARVIVGLSGGVDSAVAALLLREAGYEVQGLYMSNWDADDAYCTSAQDYQDARAVAQELGIVAAPRELRRRISASRYSTTCWPSIAPAARPIPTCCAIARSSSGCACATPRGWAAPSLPPATMRGCAQAADGPALFRLAMQPRTKPISCMRCSARPCAACCSRWANSPRREVRERARRAGLPCTTSPTAPASVSSASGRLRSS